QSAVTVSPASASVLNVTGLPSSVTAGTAASFTVTAVDAYGNTATGYRGTVHFSSSDSHAILPANYTFAAADNGVHSFSATLKTTGTSSLTVADASNSNLKGSESAITVKAVSTPAPQPSPLNVTYHGGALLKHVQVESVYYGQAWNSDTNLQQQISQVDGF